jgi:Rrf2 family protein
MVLLASATSRAPLTKFQIAEAEAISPAYVQQLMMALRRAGLVLSHRGRVGGFSLSRSPDAITVGDVLKAVEGDVMPAPCQETGHCDRMDTCPTRPVWERAAELLDDLFAKTTIAGLTERPSRPSAGEIQEHPSA